MESSIPRSFSSEDNHSDEMLEELQECADILMEKLQSDDIGGVADIVRAMVDARDRSLFNEVGRLTRGLHETLIDFHIDADLSEKDINGNPLQLDDASHRLDYVIKMMQDAANKTMDSVDEISPIANNFAEEAKIIKEEWEKLRRKEIGPEEFRQLYGRVDDFLSSAVKSSNYFSNHLREIMLAQSFQDLTGQILYRVITMVKEVEAHLVDLVRRASQVERFIGLVAEQSGQGTAPENDQGLSMEGPAVRKRVDVVSGQDEVDDLLSSLGF